MIALTFLFDDPNAATPFPSLIPPASPSTMAAACEARAPPPPRPPAAAGVAADMMEAAVEDSSVEATFFSCRYIRVFVEDEGRRVGAR